MGTLNTTLLVVVCVIAVPAVACAQGVVVEVVGGGATSVSPGDTITAQVVVTNTQPIDAGSIDVCIAGADVTNVTQLSALDWAFFAGWQNVTGGIQGSFTLDAGGQGTAWSLGTHTLWELELVVTGAPGTQMEVKICDGLGTFMDPTEFADGSNATVPHVTGAQLQAQIVAPPASYLVGDVNGDGCVDLYDVAMLDSVINNSMVPPCEAACDANSDDVIDDHDLDSLITHLCTGGATLLCELVANSGLSCFTPPPGCSSCNAGTTTIITVDPFGPANSHFPVGPNGSDIPLNITTTDTLDNLILQLLSSSSLNHALHEAHEYFEVATSSISALDVLTDSLFEDCLIGYELTDDADGDSGAPSITDQFAAVVEVFGSNPPFQTDTIEIMVVANGEDGTPVQIDVITSPVGLSFGDPQLPVIPGSTATVPVYLYTTEPLMEFSASINVDHPGWSVANVTGGPSSHFSNPTIAIGLGNFTGSFTWSPASPLPPGTHHVFDMEVQVSGTATAGTYPITFLGYPTATYVGPFSPVPVTAGFKLGKIEVVNPWSIVFLRGDCNGDGSTNIADAVTLLQHLFEGKQVYCKDACDANDDGSLDIADVIAMLSVIFPNGCTPNVDCPLFPTPGNNTCGTDPTPDSLPTCGYHSCP